MGSGGSKQNDVKLPPKEEIQTIQQDVVQKNVQQEEFKIQQLDEKEESVLKLELEQGEEEVQQSKQGKDIRWQSAIKKVIQVQEVQKAVQISENKADPSINAKQNNQSSQLDVNIQPEKPKKENKKDDKPIQHFFRKAIQNQVIANRLFSEKSRVPTEMSMDDQYNESIIRKLDQDKIQKKNQNSQKEFFNADFKLEVSIQESEMKYDKQIKGLREDKCKHIMHIGQLRYTHESLHFELVIKESYDLRTNQTQDRMNDTKWFRVDKDVFTYQNNKLYNSQENAWLQQVYMTIKGRMMEVKGQHRQDFTFWEQETENKESIQGKLAQGMKQHRVFSQVMSSEYCVVNHLRVWEGTHHSQTKEVFCPNSLKIHLGYSEKLFYHQTLDKSVQCCTHKHQKEVVFDYDSDLYVQLGFYQMQVLIGTHQSTILTQARGFINQVNKTAFGCLAKLQKVPLIPLRKRLPPLSTNRSTIPSSTAAPSPVYSQLMRSQCSSRRLLDTLEEFRKKEREKL